VSYYKILQILRINYIKKLEIKRYHTKLRVKHLGIWLANNYRIDKTMVKNALTY
jgi:hypothetical protein